MGIAEVGNWPPVPGMEKTMAPDEKKDIVGRVIAASGDTRKKRMFVYHAGGLSFGLFMIAIGVILLLGQMGIISTTYVFHYFWSAGLILFGFEAALSRNSFNRDMGIFMILAGIVLLVSKLGYIHLGFSVLWPLALIYWGLWFLVRMPSWGSGFRTTWPDPKESTARQAAQAQSFIEDGGLDVQALFGSVKPTINSKNFRGGKLESVFGEINLDLTQADIEGVEAVIKADAVFGSCEIRIPPTWDVLVRGNAVLGEYTDKTRQRLVEGSTAKRLIVRGGAVLGSVVIKN
jgi:hypothetical protein